MCAAIGGMISMPRLTPFPHRRRAPTPSSTSGAPHPEAAAQQPTPPQSGPRPHRQGMWRKEVGGGVASGPLLKSGHPMGG